MAKIVKLCYHCHKPFKRNKRCYRHLFCSTKCYQANRNRLIKQAYGRSLTSLLSLTPSVFIKIDVNEYIIMKTYILQTGKLESDFYYNIKYKKYGGKENGTRKPR